MMLEQQFCKGLFTPFENGTYLMLCCKMHAENTAKIKRKRKLLVNGINGMQLCIFKLN